MYVFKYGIDQSEGLLLQFRKDGAISSSTSVTNLSMLGLELLILTVKERLR